MLLQQARPPVWKSIDVTAWAEVKEINVLGCFGCSFLQHPLQ